MEARSILFLGLLAVAGMAAANEKDEVVFRSDVVLVRVDAQVVDRDNRAITGLERADFVLREQGREREIRNFARDEMPVDVLLLLDVSGSMRTHVERVARAASRALDALGKDDRVAIMVFDRATRVRSPFRANRSEILRDLDGVLRHEGFDGGTDITKALLEATRYVDRNARRDARRAIVILTDDQTEFEADPDRVTRALVKADTVLSALIAPDAIGRGRAGSPRQGGGWPRSGGSWPGGGWPGGGGTWPGGGRGPQGGGSSGPVWRTARTRAAGTSEIARESGGDSLRVDEASAFETTLERIRQRYGLYFLLPDGVAAGEQRSVEVELAANARRRNPGAEVRYRRVYVTPSSTGPGETPAETVEVSRGPVQDEPVTRETSAAPAGRRRRPAVNERSGPSGPLPAWGEGEPTQSREPAVAPAATQETKQQGGWRRVEEPEPASAQVSEPARGKK